MKSPAYSATPDKSDLAGFTAALHRLRLQRCSALLRGPKIYGSTAPSLLAKMSSVIFGPPSLPLIHQ